MERFRKSEPPNELQKEWNQKLKDSGFVDIEENWQSHAEYFRNKAHKSVLGYEDYYHKAQEFLRLYDFDSRLDLTIWTLHSEGKTVREIENQTQVTKSTAHRIIMRLKTIMDTAL